MKKLLTAAAVLAPTAALAHHPLGGLPMTTFAEGVLSGVGHPLLGFDHLAFVLAMGVAAAFTAQRLLTPLAYIAAMALGTLAVSLGVTLPLAEIGIVASLLVLGGLVASGRTLGTGLALTLFAGFGLFHGAGFAGSITGQEGGASALVLTGYLLGLAAIQYAIALAAGLLARRVLGATEAMATNARLIGAGVAGVGAFLALEIIEAPLVAMIAG
jgi:urease accessory protein